MERHILFVLVSALWCLCQSHPGHDHNPPKIPYRFSLRGEMVDESQNEIHSFSETIDFVAKFSRRDFVPSEAKMFQRYRKFGDRPIVVIDDFASGHEFVIDRWRGNCTLMNITSQSRMKFPDSNDTTGMKHAFRFVFEDGLKYVKSDTLRGLPVDIFSRHFNKSEIQIYFLQNVWDSVSDQNKKKNIGVPVAFRYSRHGNKTNRPVSHMTHIYDFSPDHTEFASLRMKDCYSKNQYKRVDVKIKGDPSHDLLASLDVSYVILRNLSDIMEVSIARISECRFEVGRGAGFIWFVFRLYEPITAPSYLPDPVKEANVDEAVQKLQQKVDGGLNFIVPDYGKAVTFVATEVTVFSSDDQSTSSLAMRSTDKHAGVVAGVGVLLLIIGSAVGFGVAFLVRKRFPCDKEVPYVETK